MYTTGIGGTGIVTANRILARAAVVAGYVVQGVDQTGLSQKAGAVVSHLHIAPAGADVTTATVADGDADLYLSGDILQAASATHLRKVAPGRTVAVVDAAFVPTATMLQTDGSVDEAGLAAALTEAVGAERTLLADSTGLAETRLRRPPPGQRRAARCRVPAGRAAAAARRPPTRPSPSRVGPRR